MSIILFILLFTIIIGLYFVYCYHESFINIFFARNDTPNYIISNVGDSDTDNTNLSLLSFESKTNKSTGSLIL